MSQIANKTSNTKHKSTKKPSSNKYNHIGSGYMDKAITKDNVHIKGSLLLTKQDAAGAVMGLFGFFAARILVISAINPIAIGYVSNFIGGGSRFLFIAMLTGLGFITKFQGIYLVKYILCMVIITGINMIARKRVFNPGILFKSSVAAIATLVAGIFVAIFNQMSFYFFAMAILESLFVFSITYVLKRATDVISGTHYRKALATEELISIAILLGGIIAGSADIYIGFVSLKLFFSSCVLLIVAYKGGAAFAATVGVMLGICLFATGQAQHSLATVFALGALGAGLIREKGKLATVLTFICVGIIAILLIDKSLFTMETLYSTLFGAGLFLVIPNNFYFNVNSTINPAGDNPEEYSSRLKEITTHRLNKFSGTFAKLSQTLRGISEKKTALSQKDIAKLIDELGTSACYNCSMKTFCWQDQFYETYQSVFALLGACEKRGIIGANDVPDTLRENCINVERFIETTNRLFEIYKINLSWHNKIVESRDLVSTQLLCVAGIIKNLSDELDLSLNFNQGLEGAISKELKKNKIETESLVLMENKNGFAEVNIVVKPCYGKKNCAKTIIPIIEKVLGKRLKKSSRECEYKSDTCRLRLVEEQRFSITYGIARRAKTGSSETGDSYSFMELDNGQALLVLSDGMGSGSHAREESVAAVELLEELIQSGFDKDVAIKLINSVLVLKSSEDTFSTLDICCVDLYCGETEFIKMGAVSTYILRDKDVSVIKSSSLPMGILNDVDLEITKKPLKDKDIIVMITDGILDVTDTFMDQSSWLVNAIAGFNGVNPQDIADYIIQEAQKRSPNRIKDDMTVLVARLWEKP